MRRILIGLAILFLTGGLTLGALILFNSRQEPETQAAENYRAAMQAFHAATSEKSATAITEINELANKVESSGDYAVIERAAKSYLRDVLVPYYEVAELQNQGVYQSGINAELLSNQQPDFATAISEINTMREKLTQLQNVADNLFLREAAESYLGNAELSDELRQLFDDEVKNVYDDTALKQDYFNFINTYQPRTDYYAKILDFLVANQKNWHLEDNKIIFKTTALTRQYNTLVSEKNF